MVKQDSRIERFKEMNFYLRFFQFLMPFSSRFLTRRRNTKDFIKRYFRIWFFNKIIWTKKGKRIGEKWFCKVEKKSLWCAKFSQPFKNGLEKEQQWIYFLFVHSDGFECVSNEGSLLNKIAWPLFLQWYTFENYILNVQKAIKFNW